MNENTQVENQIKKYQVQSILLRRYIKFFWKIRSENITLQHNIITTRNINVRINLSETQHYLYQNGKKNDLENIFFSGLQDNHLAQKLIVDGDVHMIGICFYPEGFYPFSQTPVSEYKNQLLGAVEAGLKISDSVLERIKEAADTKLQLSILESELLSMLNSRLSDFDNFQTIFNSLKQNSFSQPLNVFCEQNNINQRQLERQFNKYIGVSAKTFALINRFQNGINQLLYKKDYTKISDIAYENGYFDQMHYNRDFKRFTGNTPKAFVQSKKSLLQIAKFA